MDDCGLILGPKNLTVFPRGSIWIKHTNQSRDTLESIIRNQNGIISFRISDVRSQKSKHEQDGSVYNFYVNDVDKERIENNHDVLAVHINKVIVRWYKNLSSSRIGPKLPTTTSHLSSAKADAGALVGMSLTVGPGSVSTVPASQPLAVSADADDSVLVGASLAPAQSSNPTLSSKSKKAKKSKNHKKS